MLTHAPDHTEGRSWRRFARGFSYPFRGARLLVTHPRLWPFVIIPVLISMSLLGVAAMGSFTLTPLLLGALWQPAATAAWWVHWLWLAAKLLIAAGLFVVFAIGMYFGAGLVAIPFNDRLSEQVETMVLGPYEETFSWRVLAGDLGLSIAHTLMGFALWLVVMIGLFALNIIPALGSVLGFVLGLVFTSFFLGREMMDGAMSRRRLGFAHKLRIVRANGALMQGFGLATYLLLWIPFLNFFSLPCAVIGGTLLFCELEAQELLPDESGTGPLRSDRIRLVKQAEEPMQLDVSEKLLSDPRGPGVQ